MKFQGSAGYSHDQLTVKIPAPVCPTTQHAYVRQATHCFWILQQQGSRHWELMCTDFTHTLLMWPSFQPIRASWQQADAVEYLVYYLKDWHLHLPQVS